MPFLYEFTQYNTPGVGKAGGIKQQWLFTNDVVPFTRDGRTFTPAILAHDALDMSQERSSGQVSLKSTRDFPIAQLFLAGTPNGTIWLRIYNQDTGDLGYVGRIRSVTWTEAESKLLTSSPADILQREGLRVYWQNACGWNLYSPKCGVNSEATNGDGSLKYRTNATIEAVSADGLTITSAALAGRASGFFNAGKMVWNGQSRMIVAHTGSTIKLMAPFNGLAVGASFAAYKGCNRSSGAGGCQDFANQANFQGCPNVQKKNIFVSGLES